jgi:hypothetical protein
MIYYLGLLERYVGLDLLESSLLLEMKTYIEEISRATTLLLSQRLGFIVLFLFPVFFSILTIIAT